MPGPRNRNVARSAEPSVQDRLNQALKNKTLLHIELALGEPKMILTFEDKTKLVVGFNKTDTGMVKMLTSIGYYREDTYEV